ncbi:hypothetical protein BGX27_006872, partial [Mortierella sp. AM989]
MSAVNGMQGKAGPEHDHPSKDEHRRGHRHTNGHATHSSFNKQDRPGKEGVKRKISSKDYTPTGTSPGLNGPSRQFNQIYSSELQEKEDLNSLQPQNKNDYRSFLQKPPLNSHNSNQDRYNFNFNFNSETKPAAHANGTMDAVTDERKRDNHNENKAAVSQENEKTKDIHANEHGYRQAQTTGHDRKHLNLKQEQLMRKQEGSDHPHHKTTTKDNRANIDRSTPAESALNGHRGRDSHRVGSAFSARWSSIDGRDNTTDR